MLNINWRIKSLGLAITSRFAPSVPILSFLQKRITGRSLSYPGDDLLSAWSYNTKNLIDFSCTGTCIEFGAGKHLCENILLSRYTERQEVYDLHKLLDFDLVNGHISWLFSQGYIEHAQFVRSLSDLESIYGINYKAPADIASSGLETASIDACISSFTMEHIPLSDLKLILLEIKRVLRPTGICSFVIDYSDHYAYTDSTIGRLNFLRFTEEQWRRYNHANHYQNRLRHSDYIKLFNSCGFTIVSDDYVACDQKEVERLSSCYGVVLRQLSDSAVMGRFLLSPSSRKATME